MSELTKEKIYRNELEKVGGKGDNNLQRIRSLGNGEGGSAVYVIKPTDITPTETGFTFSEDLTSVVEDFKQLIFIPKEIVHALNENLNSDLILKPSLDIFVSEGIVRYAYGVFSETFQDYATHIETTSINVHIDNENGEWGIRFNYFNTLIMPFVELPSELENKTYVLKLINGTYQWVEE